MLGDIFFSYPYLFIFVYKYIFLNQFTIKEIYFILIFIKYFFEKLIFSHEYIFCMKKKSKNNL